MSGIICELISINYKVIQYFIGGTCTVVPDLLVGVGLELGQQGRWGGTGALEPPHFKRTPRSKRTGPQLVRRIDIFLTGISHQTHATNISICGTSREAEKS